MPTLNQYASKIANLLGSPGDHEVKERIKDAFKVSFANRIRQSTEKNGIDSLLQLTYVAEVTSVLKDARGITPIGYANKDVEYRTLNKVPTPIRIKSDSTFISVTDDKNRFNFIECSAGELRLRQFSPSTGFWCSYTPINGYLYIHINSTLATIEYKGDQDLVANSVVPKYLNITAIFENPEQVISMYNDTDDGQNMELPFPADMLEDIMYQIMKVEFGVMPKQYEVQLNTPTT